jgi:hypothetical protein
MTVGDLMKRSELKLSGTPGEAGLAREVKGGYVGDLLSDVVAHAVEGQVWITVQTHVNVVAIAVLKELSAIVLVNSRQPAEEAQTRALQEGVTILSTPLSAFEMAGRLFALGSGR